MRTIQQADCEGKKVLFRADFNFSLDESGRIRDDFRIRSTLPTIKYLLDKKAKIIFIAHNSDDKQTLKPVQEKLSELLGLPVAFAPDCVGEEAQKAADALLPGQMVLLENLRFHEGEKKNDEVFAKELAKLADIYVNDAFGECHRNYASMTSAAKLLPSYAGLLLQKEIENLSRAKDNPDHPLAVVIGGAKISTKIKLIQSFMEKADDIVLGGALANTVLWAQGMGIGKSFVEEDILPEVKKMGLEITNSKIHLPVDTVLCSDKNGTGVCQVGPVGKTGEDQMILDIGPDSEKLFEGVFSRAKMIIWNGAMGCFEKDNFSHGTKAVARAIAESSAFSIAGGGETVEFLEQEKLIDQFDFVSTGGGAMMEFLTGQNLPAIEVLNQ